MGKRSEKEYREISTTLQKHQQRIEIFKKHSHNAYATMKEKMKATTTNLKPTILSKYYKFLYAFCIRITYC